MDNFSAELTKFNPDSKNYSFFKKLFEKLCVGFLPRSTEKEMNEVHNKLISSIERYFKCHIVMNATIEALESLEMSHSESKSGKDDYEFNSTMYHHLIKKYLPSKESSDELNPFGLNQQDVSDMLKNKQKSELDRAQMLKLVENNIDDFSLNVIKYIGYKASSNEDWKYSFSEAMNAFEFRANMLNDKESLMQQRQKLINEALLAYYKELTEGLSLLKKLLHLHEEKLRCESDICNLYFERCRTLRLKASIFQLKLLEETYNEKTIPALKEISLQLDSKKEKLERELNEKTMAIAAYQRLGKDYETLVDEYTQLTKSIKQEKFAIEQMKNAIANDTS